MIIHSFDDRSEALFGPGDFYGAQRQLCDICILTFSHVIFSEIHRRFPVRHLSMQAANGEIPICLFLHDGLPMAACLSASITGSINGTAQVSSGFSFRYLPVFR